MKKKERPPVALITGSSSGIGFYTALSLARSHFHVIATMREPDRGRALTEEAKSLGLLERLEVKALDVRDEERIRSVVDGTAEEHGQIDILVNNAGYAVFGPVEETPLTSWRDLFETNLFGTVSMVQAVLPHMRKRRMGKIINISSGAGLIGFPHIGAYSATKFAMEGYSESLRLELLSFNIFVSLVEPGFYRTGIAKRRVVHRKDDSPYRSMLYPYQSYLDRLEAKAGDPRNVAETIRRIARSSRPRLRYALGRNVKTLAGLKRLPWGWVEAGIRSLIKK
ncbi:SDR family NAD(P)-dependent oxidoreductase [Desmospora profundinema]|uniref:NAD(P)-dependent dehydrogenase (Short-subunit alcohol dehydrogenase family) n=1 Tax=Desmospora profundinema TaxID=1571184 RepID=A0ABU1IR20_9BACL|nr:SDR family NAD(P)-dependent oxidoreductase [Desmospora profundinema]MDR6227151.1 NAD(P)-dependent dehydrogenase (short-subunit alcohol dehydrogenase family) [Desmospora profundinema]